MSTVAPGFTGAIIDRADHWRTNPERLAEARASLSARLLRLDGIDPVAGEDGRLVWGSLAEADPGCELLFLGLVDEAPRFAAMPPAGVKVDGRSRSAWRTMGHLRSEEAALYGGARSLIDWHARHRFCANCGGTTDMTKGGWGRICVSCTAEHFPRVDPVVIMLAEYDGKVLVARQPGFPPGRYSALAGFVEPGESLEEAVIRELWEEAGIRTRDVRYVASQPWPFPSSLMIACTAVADSDALTIDTTELEHAMWMSRKDIAAVMAGDADAPFLKPPEYAIAHSLLEHWLKNQGSD